MDQVKATISDKRSQSVGEMEEARRATGVAPLMGDLVQNCMVLHPRILRFRRVNPGVNSLLNTSCAFLQRPMRMISPVRSVRYSDVKGSIHQA